MGCLVDRHLELPFRAGEYARSARAAAGGLALDPYREALYQRLIRSRGLAGDRLGAAAAFARYRDLMIGELGIAPTPEKVAAYRESVGGEVAAGG